MKYFRMKLGVMKDEEGKRYKNTLISKDIDGKETVIEIEYIKREDGALIPCVEGNADYQAYLEDKDKIVEDFDYEAEELRQQTAQAEKKEADDREALIQERMRKNAEAELIAEGKIDDRDNN
jgi:hypothetical protein